MATEIDYDVRCGTQTVQVRKHGTRQWRQGLILGRESLPDRRQRVWVDRLLLPAGEVRLNAEWTSQGAISTVLEGPVEGDAASADVASGPAPAELPG